MLQLSLQDCHAIMGYILLHDPCHIELIQISVIYIEHIVQQDDKQYIGLFHLKTTPPMEEGNSVTIPVEQTVKSSRKI